MNQVIDRGSSKFFSVSPSLPTPPCLFPHVFLLCFTHKVELVTNTGHKLSASYTALLLSKVVVIPIHAQVHLNLFLLLLFLCFMDPCPSLHLPASHRPAQSHSLISQRPLFPGRSDWVRDIRQAQVIPVMVLPRNFAQIIKK